MVAKEVEKTDYPLTADWCLNVIIEELFKRQLTLEHNISESDVASKIQELHHKTEVIKEVSSMVSILADTFKRSNYDGNKLGELDSLEQFSLIHSKGLKKFYI